MSQLKPPSPVAKVSLPVTPTLGYNNLSCGGGVLAFSNLRGASTLDDVCVATVASVVVGNDSSSVVLSSVPVAEVPCKDVTAVYQTRVCSFGEEACIVLSVGAGIQIWDRGGGRLLFSFLVPTPRGATPAIDGSGSERPLIVRGICSVLAEDNSKQVCAGTSTGSIAVLDFKAGRFKHSSTIQELCFPIMDLGSDYDSQRGSASDVARQLLSADQEGNVVVWNAHSASQYARKLRISGAGSPCVGVSARGNRMVCGFGSGLIQIYNLATECLWMEVVGHSRWLSSLGMHPARDIFASTAEDGTLNVWRLPSECGKLGVLFSSIWKDAMVTGVAFCGKDGQVVATTAYDHDRLCLWRIPAE